MLKIVSGQAPVRVTPPGAAMYADLPSRAGLLFRSFARPCYDPDDTGGGATPPANPPANPPDSPPAAPPAPDVASLNARIADLEKIVADTRQEAAKHRVTANDYKTKLDAIERDALSEQDRLKADLTKATNETIPALLQRNRTLEVQVAAAAKSVVDPEAASALLDWSSVDGGKTVAEALDALIAAKPWLLKTQATTPAPVAPSTTSPAAGAQSGSAKTSFTQAEIDAMSDAEYEAQRPAIIAALAQGRVKKA